MALVGANGSGKTTLVKLICQLYEPTEGRVLWNDVDATTHPARRGRGGPHACCFRTISRYHLSAPDNIVFGRVDRPARLEDAIVAARRAGAHEFLSRLPQGYDTRMGLEFSGGRSSRSGSGSAWRSRARSSVTAASSFSTSPPRRWILARNATCSTQIRSLAEGRSVLLISHRFSSTRSADRIYVLDEGRITSRARTRG